MKTKKNKAKKAKKQTALAVQKPVVEIQKVKEGAPLSPIETVLVGGDLAKLTPDNRFNYYLDVCKSLQLNPLTQPFGYISIDGKMTLYAKKDCAEQLRKIHGVGITSLKREFDEAEKIVTVDVTGKDKYGKVDAASGSLHLQKWNNDKKTWVDLKGQDRANAIMKCETKAKRRLTLSICGLSMPDESEVIDIKDAVILPDEKIQETTGIKIAKKAEPEAPNPEKIIKALPQEVKDSLIAAGFNSIPTAYKAYQDVAGDVDALLQYCQEKIRDRE